MTRRRHVGGDPRRRHRRRQGPWTSLMVAVAETPADVDEARRASHDSLIERMGDRRTGGVTWRFWTGTEAQDLARRLIDLEPSYAQVLEDPTLWDAPDPAAERSRATMWDVVRFAEQMVYDAIVVENVVEATKWALWPAWLQAMLSVEDRPGHAAYEHKVLSHNSMHHGVPQSRDRIYVVFWLKGLTPDLELEQVGHCGRCEASRACRQAWKNNRWVGRYRQQWRWACTVCGSDVEPATEPAARIIDWSIPTPRIGDRPPTKRLSLKTRQRIYAGLARYGWAPVLTTGAGNTHERTPGNRARQLTDPLPTQQTTAQTALATPPGFLFQTAHQGRVVDIDRPHPTICASDDRHALVVANNENNVPRSTDEPLSTVTTGNRHYVIEPPEGVIVPLRRNTTAKRTGDPLSTVCASGGHHALVVRSNGFLGSGDLGRFTSTSDLPLPTVTTTQRPALIMRGSTGGAEMVTPADEPVRTLTTKPHQSLLVPYNGTGVAKSTDDPVGTLPATDRWALVPRGSDGRLLVCPELVIDDCGFRMLTPPEIAAGMAFPIGYIPTDLPKYQQVKLAGNAVTPPVMTWIIGRLLQALEAAA